ncbi:MAG: M6 family metalloprotease domain-containing protein [Bacteroidales bacterium]|nr:M6 family metalloprotease domain-containing protein [Bacteroidales bacterium]
MRWPHLFVLFLLMPSLLWAVGSYPDVIVRRQPDGSVIQLLVHGDERFHYCTTLSGVPVCQGKDGYYYLATVTGSSIVPSFQRMGGWSGTGVLDREVVEDPMLAHLRESAHAKWDRRNAPTMTARPMAASLDEIRVLVIPVAFRDVNYCTSQPRMYLDHLLNAPVGSDAYPSAKSYFQDNLGETVAIQFDVIDPVVLPRSRVYYGSNDEMGQDANVAGMVEEACLLAVKQNIDLSQYDLDQDGAIDYLFIYYAGHNEAESALDETIWPHSGDLRAKNLFVKGTQIARYSCTSELKGADGEELAGIGTFCHEFSHLLGLVDLYDTDGSLHGNYRRIWGPLALMNQGAYNNGGHTPPYFGAIDLELLGLADYLPVNLGSRVELHPVGISHQVLKIDTPNPNEYYLLEMRNNASWDQYLGGKGMLVYHVDKSTNAADGIQAKMRWQINRVNGSSKHPCAHLVGAVDFAPEVGSLFFPGHQQVFSLTTKTSPPLISWQGQGCGVGIDSIRMDLSDGLISFSLIQDLGNRLPKITHHYAQAGQQEIQLRWYADIRLDIQWQIEWRSLAESVYRSITVSEMEYTISALDPNELYVIRITPRTNELLGETYTLSQRTENVTAPFPVIVGMDRTYRVGDELRLVINNLVEPVQRTRWLLNGRLVEVNSLILKEPGPLTIQAEVMYQSDGSWEYLYKTIEVLPQEEALDE